MTIFQHLSHIPPLLILFPLFTILYASDVASNKLVKKVCDQTSDHSFCINSLYSDSRTPGADDYTLAFVSVGLAYANATATRDYLNSLPSKPSSSYGGDDGHQGLIRCSRDYSKAVSALLTAYNDLNSESFFELANLAGDCVNAVNDCEAAVQGITPSPMGKRNGDLKGLCDVFAVVIKSFTVSSG
ncbi:hypothetical protein K2173_013131 [Erythroxylum novogranatense]|uniref:Pectinesterase inhibitor domain-containing protein n=1 Tax=Erythroxylum novogranatense TaxID=1862640 RepID=A0AAV8S574_9ROSI|nr:hypothetical protein K2173_013131 [Erythroxylum novogranatense]